MAATSRSNGVSAYPTVEKYPPVGNIAGHAGGWQQAGELPQPGSHGPGAGPDSPPSAREKFFANTTKDQTLGQAILGGLLKIFTQTSHTVARIDLARPSGWKPRGQRRQRGGPPAGTVGGTGGADSWAQGGGGGWQGSGPTYYQDGPHYQQDYGRRPRLWLPGQLRSSGARLKLMQVWDFPDPVTGEPRLPYRANFGVGANFDMDRSELQPRARLSIGPLRVHLLPEREVEIRKRWPITGTQLAVDVRYRIPLTGADRFWAAPSARLMVLLMNPLGTGFHLRPGGISFDEQVLKIGQHTTLRVAAEVDFPNELPPPPPPADGGEAEPPLKVRVSRLGVRTRLS